MQHEPETGQQVSQAPGGNPTPPPRKTRSESRQKRRVLSVRISEDEERVIAALAERAGLTVGSYVRSRVLEKPTTRAMRRPSVEMKALAAVLASLNKSGNNLNQLARAVNLGNSPTLADIRAAVMEHREILALIFKILGREGRG